ncbi:uncharacterized protein BT62DRAFT_1073248 [Guyanagaster necrorhizus]|uniref:F-box domain-containing protein n=1 Tax=Guyanagaster necrorhizus TaxID=856835 RepID=A0A9P7W0B4_9AGAR|nr:uncharacterized protein BT62DRAFT_1073248 [Guyanagaster necrorhizus MCA 3950]KAG7449832.1 hypothetical protein BT62DRAFT_1073248 [Guyanagaster necrorhizus MCA 3950]
MTLSLSSLPEDILYNVFYFLSPVSILKVRQVSKDLYSLTRQKIVWTNAYRTSNSFLPVEPPADASAFEVERALLSAIKLDEAWRKPQPEHVCKRFLKYSPGRSDNIYIKLYHGRYLMIGSRSSFSFYDLDAKPEDWGRPIFGSGESESTYSIYRVNTDDSAKVSYISAVAMSRLPQYFIRIWQIDFVGKTLLQVADVPIGRNMSSFAKITNGWLVHGANRQQGSNAFNAVLFHIPTRRIYEVPVYVPSPGSGEERIFQIDYIIAPQHLLLMYISRRQTLFEAFPLPNTNDTVINRVLSGSHSGICPSGFTETTFVSASDQAKRIRLLGSVITGPARGMPGVRVFDVVLKRDGLISFPEECYNNPMSGYNLHLTLSRSGAVRGICMAPTTFTLLRVDFGPTAAGDMQLDITELGLKMDGVIAYDVDFDGFRGRLCLVRDEGVMILDYI